MSGGALQGIVALLISGGGAAFVLALMQGWRDIRQGARTNQRELMQDVIKRNDELEEEARWARRDRDFWRDLAARRGHQLRTVGIIPASPDPVPPSERDTRQEI